MIKTLHIRNFQVFEDIEIAGLRRVNLIAGKNNCGKTALLEALRIYKAGGDTTVVNHVLSKRGQWRKGWDSSYEALYNRKKFNEADGKNGQMTMLINNLVIMRKRVSGTGTTDTYSYFANPDFRAHSQQSSNDVIKFNPSPSKETQLLSNIEGDDPKDKAVFLPFGSGLHNLEDLWQKIVLTPQEDEVLDIIRETIEPRLIRLDMTGGITKVRLKQESTPVPLSSLGDGVQRMLLLAVALVSAKGNLLLLDEFEAGLHHSVQKKLWETMFEYALKWDIQIFATTHSEDTVRKFFYVADSPQYEKEALFLRLQFDRMGVHEAEIYDMERLGNSLELHLETR